MVSGCHRKEEKRSGDKAKESKPRKESRSNPKMSYNLEDATPEEKALIKKGGINDKINTLSLLCARNPSTENYKQLLYFAKDQRNDVIYLVLKNLRDLLKERVIEEAYIKGRIIKSFEMGMKNQYIKNKVVEMVGVLIRAGVYEEELLVLLVERLGEKGETLGIVQEAIKSVFDRFERLIVECIEDFYFKNDTFRSQYYVLRFLRSTHPIDKEIHFRFYNTALSTLDQTYPENQQDILLGQIILGLATCYTEGSSSIESIGKIREWINSDHATLPALELLIKMRDKEVGRFILRVAKGMHFRKTPQEPAFLNAIVSSLESKIENTGPVLIKLLNSCFYYTTEYILALLMIADSQGVPPQPALWLLARHYHPLVRQFSLDLLRGKKLSSLRFDPYDKVAMSMMISDDK